MAVRTFRGTVNADWNTAGNWLELAVPTNADTVFFDALSPACTLSAAGACLTLDCTNFRTGGFPAATISPGANRLTVAGTQFLLVAGAWVAGANAFEVDFTAVAGVVAITSAGNPLNSVRLGNAGAGATFTPQDGLATVQDLSHVNGLVNTNNQAITVGRHLTIGAAVAANSWTAGASVITIAGDLNLNASQFMNDAAHWGTSLFDLTGNGTITLANLIQCQFYDMRVAGAGKTTNWAPGGTLAITMRHRLTLNGGILGYTTANSGNIIIEPSGAAAVASSFTVVGGSVCSAPITWSPQAVPAGTNVYPLPLTAFGAGLALQVNAGANQNVIFRLTGNTTVGGAFSIGENAAIAGGLHQLDFNNFDLLVTGNFITGSASYPKGFVLNIGGRQLVVGGTFQHKGTTGSDARIAVMNVGTISVAGNLTLGAAGFTNQLFALTGACQIVCGGSWNSAANAGPVFTPGLDTPSTVRFAAGAPFTITADANEYWPNITVTGGGTCVLPNGFNCYSINIFAGLITAGNPFTCRTSLTNAGTFTGSANMLVGTSFVNTGVLVMAGTVLRLTGALCSVSGVNPVTLSMAPTCLRLQLLSSMTITTFNIEDRTLPGVVQYLAGGTYAINTFNSQVASTDGTTQFVSSVAGTRYTWRIGVAITSLANIWPRDNDASAGAIAPVGGITVKDLGNNAGWTFNPGAAVAAYIRVITEDAGQDLLAAGGIGPINYCWLVGTSLVAITALVAAYAAGANNWHRKTCIPFAILDNLVKGATYWIALGLVDDRGRRASPNIGAGDFATAMALSPESGGGGTHNLHVQTLTVAAG
jgi:hypothetical protein